MLLGAVGLRVTVLPLWLLIFVALIFFQGSLIHSNLNWDFGPLKYVFVSPRFHRYHHSTVDASRHKNFGGLFSFWDYLFGTAYCPVVCSFFLTQNKKAIEQGIECGVRAAFDHGNQLPDKVRSHDTRESNTEKKKQGCFRLRKAATLSFSETGSRYEGEIRITLPSDPSCRASTARH